MKQLSVRVIFVAALLTCILLLAKGLSAEASVEFYVSPTGNDNNPGTKEQPFAGLTRARDAVRERTQTRQTADIVVFLRGGTYKLQEPLALGPEDSGTDKFSITHKAFPGEKPIISGGRTITGWKPGPGKIWQADLPQVRAQNWYFRQLFVDGRRATRARTPNADSESPYLKVKDAELNEEMGTWKVNLEPGQVRHWSNVADVEIFVLGHWDIIRKRLASVDQAKGEVILAPPHVGTHHHDPQSDRWCFFENAIEMLDQPGEWYLDRSKGIISYWPLDGQDMSKVEAVAPVLTQLLEIAGTAKQLVRNVHFKGLSFQHAHWSIPKWGFTGRQGGTIYLPDKWAGFVGEAILWRFTDSCSLTDSEITHVDGCGISLRRGCVKNLIEGNHIHDIASNGINVGEDLSLVYNKHGFVGPRSTPNYKPPPREVPRRNRIANNYIHDCGAYYYGGVGIYVAFTDGTVLSHNLIHDLPYTGISVGMMWGSNPAPLTVCRNNIIEYNHIYDVMKRMGDGAGIYMLGAQPGTVIRGNVIHDVRRSPFTQAAPNAGLYFDSGSSEMLVQDNIIYALALPHDWPCSPVFFGQGATRIVLRRNVFVSRPGGKHYYMNRKSTEEDFKFQDNTMTTHATWQPPAALETRAGLEAPYRRALLGQ